MSLAAQSQTAAGALAAAAAIVLWRGGRRATASAAYRWFAAVAAAWGAGFVAQQALIGPLGGAAVPLTFGDLLSLLALPAMVAGFAALAAAARQQDGSGDPGAARRAAAAGPAPRDAVARLADGYILAAALFITGWVTIFGPIYHRSGDGAGTFVLALLHPLADLAVLGVVLPYAVRAGRRAVTPFLALLAVTLSDALSVGAKVNAAGPGGWAQLAQLAAFCLLGAAPLVGARLALPGGASVRGMTRLARRGQARRPGDLVTQLAALAAAVAAAVVVARALAGRSVAEPAVAVIGGMCVLALAARIAGLLVSDRAAAVTRQESGRQFRELADCITDAVLVCDLDGTIRYASPAVAEYGYTPQRLDGMSLPDLIHSEDLPDGIGSVHAAAASPAARRFPCRVRSSDGTWRHVEATVTRQRYPGSAEQLLVTARNVSDQVALRRQVTHLTFHDGLTGLPNRAYLEERAKDVLSARQAASGLAAAEMPAGGLAIDLQEAVTGAIFVDLDGFTGVNDSVGHGAGDLLLAQAARRLRAAVPPHETVARWGGDEFAVLVENAAKAQEIVGGPGHPADRQRRRGVRRHGRLGQPAAQR